MVLISCQIKAIGGRYLRMRKDMNGSPYLLLEDSQNGGQDVPSILVDQNTGCPGTICLYFHDCSSSNYYLLTVKDANPTLVKMENFKESSANPYWIKKVLKTGGTFSLSPFNAPGMHLVLPVGSGRSRNASLSEISYTFFCQ